MIYRWIVSLSFIFMYVWEVVVSFAFNSILLVKGLVFSSSSAIKIGCFYISHLFMSILMAWCNTTIVEPLVVTDHNFKIFPVEGLYLESRKRPRPLFGGDDFVFFLCFYPLKRLLDAWSDWSDRSDLLCFLEYTEYYEHVVSDDNFGFNVNGSSRFGMKYMKSLLAQCMWVTLLPGMTFLHINRLLLLQEASYKCKLFKCIG